MTKGESTEHSFRGEGKREGGRQGEGEEGGGGQGGGRERGPGGEGGDRVGHLRGGAGVGEGEGALIISHLIPK